MPDNWFENDDFWQRLGPLMFTEKRLAMANDEVADIIVLTKLAAGSRVLDLPCGWGRHSIALAKLGHHVTAVDRTAAYLERATRFAIDAHVSIDFDLNDMRAFRGASPFDAAICMYTSLGYFETRDEELAALANYRRNLRIGGKLVIQVTSKEIIARQFEPKSWREVDGVFILEERQIIDGWSRIRNRWTIIDGPKQSTFEFAHWLYSAAELKQLLEQSGFGKLEILGDLKRSPYDNNASWLVIVAEAV